MNRGKMARRITDVALGAGLGGMLLLVYIGDLVSNRAKTGGGGTNTPATITEEAPTRPLRLAVTPPEYDDMGALLKGLGEGYKFTDIPLSLLQNYPRLSEFDVVFFTCGKSTKLAPIVKENLRKFVANGGTLYASDLRFEIIAEAFPEFVDPVTNAQGIKQDVRAEVVDPALQLTIGPEMPLHFDEDGWRPAAFKGPDLQVLLRSTIKTNAGIPILCPLLVQFTFQEGTVVFTSFHNEKQQKGLEERLLRHLVFAAVTARTQSKVTKTMVSGGFSPQSHNLLSTSKGSPTVSQVHYNKTAGHLKFVLGFEDQGAAMRLEVLGPDGQVFKKEGASTFTIDVPAAAPGDWKYTITALKVPYPNFPFTLTVGSEQNKPRADQIANPIPIARGKGDLIEFKELGATVPQPVKNLRLAVTPHKYDDMGKLLRSLGEGYSYTSIELDDTRRPDRLAEYDIVFLTCNTVPDNWVGKVVGKSARPGLVERAWNPVVAAEFRNSLRSFVGNGGTLYASDLHLAVVLQAFPEFNILLPYQDGIKQEIMAEVMDEGLRTQLEKKRVPLRFDMDGWRPAGMHGPRMQVLLRGEYRSVTGKVRVAPLLVKVPYEKGAIIFTSFHNEDQNNELETKLLKYLVFTAVTAKVQAAVNKTMESNGFFPKQEGLFSHSAGNPTITRSYSNKKVGPLQFALGLQAQGAKMKFTIQAPGGQKYEKVTTSTLTVEAPAAPMGEWLYTVEALEVPYANFPFTVTVGEKQG